MRKKILVDVYLAFNLGDDLFLDYLAKHLPDTDFTPFHPGSNYDSFFSGYSNIQSFPYSTFDKIKARLGINKLKDYEGMAKEFDGLLFLGGGIFREESYWKEVFEYRKSISDAFINLKKPVWLTGCNFGPFQTEEFLTTYKNLFARVTRISMRDRKSASLFPNLDSLIYAPDMLWNYPLKPYHQIEKQLGISVIAPSHKEGWTHKEDAYIEAHQKMMGNFLKKGFRVKLFAFCPAEKDKEICRSIQRDKKEVEIISYSGNLEAFLKSWCECSHVIASRFHAIILGMKTGQKILPVVYSEKTSNLLQDLSVGPPYISLKNISNLPQGEFLSISDNLISELASDSEKHLDLGL